VSTAQEITVREAARRAHRSPETVRRWIWSGRLPAAKRGNTYYVDVAHLEGLVAEMDSFRHAAETVPPGRLSAWLAELGQWRSGLAATGSPGAAETASDLVLEDRRARR
jgi:excisionase family DNA binding protein